MERYINYDDIEIGGTYLLRTKEDLESDPDVYYSDGDILYEGFSDNYRFREIHREFLGKEIRIKDKHDLHGSQRVYTDKFDWWISPCYIMPVYKEDIPEIETDDVDLCFLFS